MHLKRAALLASDPYLARQPFAVARLHLAGGCGRAGSGHVQVAPASFSRRRACSTPLLGPLLQDLGLSARQPPCAAQPSVLHRVRERSAAVPRAERACALLLHATATRRLKEGLWVGWHLTPPRLHHPPTNQPTAHASAPSCSGRSFTVAAAVPHPPLPPTVS